MKTLLSIIDCDLYMKKKRKAKLIIKKKREKEEKSRFVGTATASVANGKV